MNSHTTKRFREAFRQLPDDVRERARKTFQVWQANPNHPALKFKQIYSEKPIYSVRIGLGWRALGVKEQDTVIWFWIGSHSDYDRMISQL